MNDDRFDRLLASVLDDLKQTGIPLSSQLFYDLNILFAEFKMMSRAQNASIVRAMHWWQKWKELDEA